MSTNEMTLNEIRAKGNATLVRELGPAGYVRFLQQFSMGKGDFTAERRPFVDSTTPEQLREMITKRRGGE